MLQYNYKLHRGWDGGQNAKGAGGGVTLTKNNLNPHIMRLVLEKQLLQTISFYFQFVELRVLQHDCYTISLWEGVRVEMGVRGGQRKLIIV